VILLQHLDLNITKLRPVGVRLQADMAGRPAQSGVFLRNRLVRNPPVQIRINDLFAVEPDLDFFVLRPAPVPMRIALADPTAGRNPEFAGRRNGNENQRMVVLFVFDDATDDQLPSRSSQLPGQAAGAAEIGQVNEFGGHVDVALAAADRDGRDAVGDDPVRVVAAVVAETAR
jgi:hypothetical protein